MNFKNLEKKKVISAVAIVLGVISGAYVSYAYLPMATGGSMIVTQRDVSTYRSAISELQLITGNGEKPTREDALKTIATTYAQYDLLKKKGIVLDPEKVNLYVESSTPLKGILKRLKASLGEERYFRTITLPTAIGKPFADYYSVADPKAQQAKNLLSNAMSSSLNAAAEKDSLKVQDITIPNEQDTAQFFDAAAKSIGKPISQIIDGGGMWLVVQPRERVENKIVASAVSIPKTPPADFFQSELKTAGVPLRVKPWAFYSDNKFFTPPAAPAEAKKEEAAANAPQK